MDDGTDVAPNSLPRLSEEERAAMFRSSAPIDRNARRRGGKSSIPPKAVAWLLVIFAVLGLGGEAGEHYFGNFGVTSATTTKFLPSNANLAPVRSVNEMTEDSFIGLKEISNAVAPSFTLVTQNDRKWNLSRVGHKVVVLFFENTTCNDICPVLGAEMKEARAQLGSNARSIVFAIVNTDPRNIAVNPHPLALELPHLEGTPNVVFLTGSLHRLNSVWVKYGIRIKVGSAPSEVSHNNEIYFIGAKHRLEALATPFAKVSNKNAFSLSATYIARYAKGIAETAISLVE